MKYILILAPKNNIRKKVPKQMAEHLPAGKADRKKGIWLEWLENPENYNK